MAAMYMPRRAICGRAALVRLGVCYMDTSTIFAITWNVQQCRFIYAYTTELTVLPGEFERVSRAAGARALAVRLACVEVGR